ncbi:hypothetical protein P8H27_15590 [Pseudomonas sp. sp1636]|uniref:hypothetical protein n=1 Tax=Pseudomonas sp. sp1636 TaxID=3036707 RepID=UPI0025A68179|nr:hypothetical protein [Pseudomonas sp. sp1636]MDM8350303.1 hypothetical protein [Pseudomonas sp. sp1636]
MKRTAIPQAIRQGDWPRVEPATVPQAQWPDFARKRLAVSMYIDGASMKAIRLQTGMPSNEINRLAHRFCSMDEEGHYFGERALIAYTRIVPYERRKPIGVKRSEQQGGLTGALNMLLSEHPEIEAAMIDLLCTPGAVLNDDRGGMSVLVSAFKQALEKAGIASPSWPFNTKHKGRTTIRKYLKALRVRFAVQYIHAHGDEVAVAHLATGTGHRRFIHPKRPFDCVQLDGHHIDAIFALRVEEMPGFYQWIAIDRIWLLSMIEPFSNAVLAYKLVLRSEVSAADVREVIAQACLGKWCPRALVNEKYQYKPGAGLPSGVIEGCQGISFGVFFADSHLSNLAKKITTEARRDFGFQVCIGPVGHFEVRAEIERSFLEVVREVHLLVSSTGSHPHAGRAKDAEQKAVKYEIDFTLMEDAIDVLLANYNVTPSEGLGLFSPLGYLEQFFRQGALIPSYSAEQRERLQADLTTRKATVRGSCDSGRRPYIQLDRVRYTSAILAGDFAFVGMQLLIEVDNHDYRAVKAYLPNGESIGYLCAQGWWGEFKHTPSVRLKVNSLIRSGDLKIDEDKSPTQQLSDYFTQHGQAGVALSLSREAATQKDENPRPRKNRAFRPDYFIQADSEYGELPSPGRALNRVER